MGIQQINVIPPLSAPSNNNRFSGRTAIVVRSPLKVSDFNFDDENEAVVSMGV